jgi:choline dehydrogenase-like flavoprotein
VSVPAIAERRREVERLLSVVSSPHVRDGAAQQQDQSLRAQVCVVGSGAGGATIARELARRGHSVVLLEEGAYRTGRDFGDAPSAMLRALYRDGGSTGTSGRLAIPIPLGRCVGGTTTIGWGSLERAPDDVLRSWEADEGVSGVGPGDLARHFSRAESELGAEPVPDEHFGRNGSLLERGAAMLGHAGTRVARGVRGCLATGVCSLGCPQDAKQAMHVSYVPAALGAGAKLYTRTRAERLLLSHGRVFGVQARFLDDDDRPTPFGLRVIADRVVVACGALLTPAFLERSGVKSESSLLGRNLRIHPALRVVARFPDEVRAWAEVPQSYAVRQFAEDGIAIQNSVEPPSITANGLPMLGMAHKEVMARYPHLASCSVVVADQAGGTVRAGRRSFPEVTYALHEVDRRKLLRGASLAAEMLFAAGAIEVYPAIHSRPVLRSADEAVALRDADVREHDLMLEAFCPSGTARMADDAKQGATSAMGEVHGTRDLFVVDASLFPSSCRAAPQLTIVALAMRIGEWLSDELGAPL